MRSVGRMVLVMLTFVAAASVEAQRQQGGAPALPALSPEAEAALQELDARFATQYGLTQGWFRDRPVAYYDFGTVPAGVAPGRVLFPIHGFDARGNPVAIRGQRPIFSVIPGLEGYSGVYRLAYVVTADHAQPNELRDLASVEALVRRGRASIRETDATYNMPIVPRGSTLARDSTPPMMGWYEGREVQFFDFGAASTSPAPMWRFVRGTDASGQPQLLAEQGSVVDSIPVAGSYPDLWEIHFATADSTFVPNSAKNAAAVRDGRFVIGETVAIRNLPIVFVDDAPVQRAPSPVRRFSDLRSPFPPAPTRP